VTDTFLTFSEKSEIRAEEAPLGEGRTQGPIRRRRGQRSESAQPIYGCGNNTNLLLVQAEDRDDHILAVIGLPAVYGHLIEAQLRR
jgi:hypothetical protein